jgi:hypothetical protein
MPSAFSSPADRRVFPRTTVVGHAQGKRLGYRLSLRQWPRVDMEIRDLSLGGLSALSTMPFKKGEKLSLHVRLEPNTGEWDARGRVVRCEPSATGYRVAVAFESLMAAQQAA